MRLVSVAGIGFVWFIGTIAILVAAGRGGGSHFENVCEQMGERAIAAGFDVPTVGRPPGIPYTYYVYPNDTGLFPPYHVCALDDFALTSVAAETVGAAISVSMIVVWSLVANEAITMASRGEPSTTDHAHVVLPRSAH